MSRVVLSVPKTPDERSIHVATDKKKTYSTHSPEAPPALASMIEDAENALHPNWSINQPDSEPRGSFNEFNADSLNILVIYWYRPPNYWQYLNHATWINAQIMECFNAEGIDFAFPTQVLHLASDIKRPLNVGQRVASKDQGF